MTVSTYARSPEETLKAIEPWLKRAGVSRLADVTDLDCIGIPVYASIRPDSKSLKVDSGKGTTKAQARCSAAMESLERWALDEVPLTSLQQQTTDSREIAFQLNRGAQLTDFVLRSITWTEATDHLTGSLVQVPYFAVKLYDGSERLPEKCWYASTNGMAAASTREDAILGGLYEVIERDGVHLAITAALQGVEMPRLDLSSIDEDSAELIGKIENSGAHIFIFDARNETRLPSFMGLIVDTERLGLWRGYGAHSDKHIALTRAICETAQTRAILMAGARDDILWQRHQKLMHDSSVANWVELLNNQKPTVDFNDYPSLDGSVFERMAEVGRRVLVVDFPVPGAPFSVVKILVPGIASYWNTYCEPGRP
jgi:ribosomal protein S12 methylthiotransferase accessory factor